ncbi:DUF1116 domain-containing protein [Arthrobacter sp. zg-Y40]|uniref:oxamate carbamoyltransferase subunit AllG family protein n=1 Tax=Arthrobacter sp. zg-Y40 TaxID=2886939 RepID=UPI001D1562F6|nr:DUF1116 domain-containing protein [Arthrobacter sp. zg-Y40]MCC3278682.1 DUF1116 domain-containing protein [Arthrobacter sp. zg-Y40]
MTRAEPFLVDVLPALEAVPGMQPSTILVAGPLLPWVRYTGIQRLAVIGAALFEGLAATPEEADTRLRSGAIRLGSCHEHGSVGSLTGVCTASMPVLVVRDEASGTTTTCRMNEGPGAHALTFGSTGDAVHANLAWIRDKVAPALGAAVRDSPIPLLPIMARALADGDDLHGRQQSAGRIFHHAVRDRVVAGGRQPEELLSYLETAAFHFLHIAMAAAKAISTAAEGVPGSTVVTAMAMNEREFGVRVSGAPGVWFRAALPPLAPFRGVLQAPWTPEDLGYGGGDSLLMETLGMGGAAAAAAPSLTRVSVGNVEAMKRLTASLYSVTVTEHPILRIPSLGRGIPWGLDSAAVTAHGLVPPVHLGATLRTGGLAGAMLFTPPLQPFIDATKSLHDSARAHNGTGVDLVE